MFGPGVEPPGWDLQKRYTPSSVLLYFEDQDQCFQNIPQEKADKNVQCFQIFLSSKLYHTKDMFRIHVILYGSGSSFLFWHSGYLPVNLEKYTKTDRIFLNF